MKQIFIAFLLLLLALAACSPEVETPTASNTVKTETDSTTVNSDTLEPVETASDAGETSSDTADNPGGEETVVEAAANIQLDDGYKDALSITGQLAVGTMQLEGTDLAMAEDQAAELLPLWQALQALSQSDMTAEIELEAVINQIQETMMPEQIRAIAGMALTSESLADLQSSGALAMGGFGMRGGQDSESGEMPAGARGGMGGGMGPGGGMAPGGAVDEDAMATRQAQFEDGSMEDFIFTNMVVRFLQTKTGEAPVFGRGGNGQMAAIAAVGEATGLAIPDIQAEQENGKSLAEVVTENGGDLETVEMALQEALAEVPLPEGQDLDAFIDQLLNGTG